LDDKEWVAEDGWKVLSGNGAEAIDFGSVRPSAQTDAVMFYTFHRSNPRPEKGKKIYAFDIYNKMDS
jgi:hypothetical protein